MGTHWVCINYGNTVTLKVTYSESFLLCSGKARAVLWKDTTTLEGSQYFDVTGCSSLPVYEGKSN